MSCHVLVRRLSGPVVFASLLFVSFVFASVLCTPAVLASGPEVTNTAPGTNAVGVPRTDDIVATFDTTIDTTTITTDTFVAQGMMGGVMAGSFSFSTANTVVSLDSDRPFFAGEVVRTSLTNGIEDTSGFTMTTPHQWQFTTGPVFARCLGGFVHDEHLHFTAINSGVAAFGDYDRDGHLDVFISGWDPSHVVERLYHNNGDGTFTRNEHSGLPGLNAGSAEWGDYNNDGYLDMLVTSVDHTRVYRNNGDGTFADIHAGLTSVYGGVGVWGDYDNDGYLDILLTGSNVSTNDRVSEIYHNDSGTGFTRNDAATAALNGVTDGDCAWGDYDNDGYLDLLLTGHTDIEGDVRVSEVYHNTGAGSFTQTYTLTGVMESSVAWGDYDKDGYLDILYNGDSGGRTTELYHNDGGAGFTRNDTASDEMTDCDTGALAWGDYDNDGYLDVLLTGQTGGGGQAISKLYRNNGNGTFTDIDAGLQAVDQSTASWGDVDGDGDLDVLLTGRKPDNDVISYLYLNDDCPELAIDKWVEPDPAEYHGVVTYTVAVTNTEYTATGVRMTDTLSSKVTFDEWVEQSGAHISDDVITWHGEVPGNDAVTWSWTTRHTGAGDETVTNTAWYEYDGSTEGYTVTFRVNPPPPLHITKTVTPESGVDYRGTVTYTVTVYNYLTVPAEDVRLTDTLPSEVDFGGWIEQSGANVVDDVITWNGSVAQDETVVWSWWVTHTGGYDDVVTNTARYECRGMTGSDSAVFTVKGPPVLSFSKQAAPNEDVPYHGTVDYTVQLTNTGESPAAGVRLTDTLPGEVDFGHWTEQSGATESNDVITWNGIAGADSTITWAWAVTHTGNYGDVVTNTARYEYLGVPEEASAGFVVEPEWTRVTATDPLTNEVGVATNTDIAAAFENALGAAINPSTVTTGTFVAQGMMSGFFTGVYDAGTQTATLHPARDFFPGETVRTSLTSGIESTDGTPLTPYQWQFTAGPVLTRCFGGFEEVIQASEVLTGVGDSSVAWGDYDSDGDLDILLTGWSGHNLSEVFRNDGQDTFTPIGAGLRPVAWSGAAWGDYDNDGDLDILLTGSPTDDNFVGFSAVYRNESGAFTDIDAGLTGVSEGSVAWGDYDNDGYLDILLTGYSDHHSDPVSEIYHNDGDGTFTKIDPGLPGVFVGSAAWGDYDNDGYLDVLLTGADSDGMLSRVYRNNGDGTFHHTHSFTPLEYSSAAWGDYDNDRYLDVLLTGEDEHGNLVSELYHNEAGAGFSKNETASAVLKNVYTSSAAWGDYDNDGSLDILLAGYDKPNGGGVASRVYHNNGDGTFTDIAAGLAGAGVSAVAWGDFDNDGDLDILLTGYDRHDFISRLYRNEDCYALSIEKSVTPRVDVGYHGLVTYTVVITNDGAMDASGLRMTDTLPAKVDFGRWVVQSDAIESGGEITWTGTVSKNSSGTWSWLSNHTGHCGDVVTNTAEFDHPTSGRSDSSAAVFNVIGDVMRPTATDPVTNALSVALTADIATRFDHAVSFGTVTTRTFAAQGMMGGLLDGVFSYDSGDWTVVLDPGRSLFPGEVVRTSLTSDIASTEDDPLVPYQWQFTAGTVTLPRCVEFNHIDAGLPTDMGGEAVWGDYDGDGYLDVVLNSRDYHRTRIYHNNGDGSFTNATPSGLPQIAGGSYAWGDYDNDGDLDLLFTGQDESPGPNGTVQLWRNEGNGVFTNQTPAGLPDAQAGHVAWGDYDNDGRLDFLLTGEPSGVFGTWLWHNEGNGAFTDQSPAGLPGVKEGSHAWGDYDNDGDLDFLLTGSDDYGNPVSQLWRNDGNGFFSDHTPSQMIDVLYSAVAWGDYDNDGDLDILLTGSHAGYVSTIEPVTQLLRNDGNGTFSDQTPSGVPDVALSSVAWGDYDNDGDLDFLLTGCKDQEYTTVSQLWRNEGSGIFTDQTPAGLPALWRACTAWGDSDNDGDLDFLIVGNITGGDPSSQLWRNDDCAVDLVLSKEVSHPVAAPGQVISYTIVYTNAGPGPAYGTLLTDVIPTQLGDVSYFSSGPAITPTGDVSYTWQVENLLMGEGGTVTITAQISPSLPYGSFIVNTATISNPVDAPTANSSDSVTITLPLRLVSTDPITNAVGVQRDSLIAASFTNGLDATTVQTGTFTAQGMMGGLLNGTYSLGDLDQTAILHPDRTLFAGEIVRTSLTGGIESAGGVSLVPAQQWQFTAGDVFSSCFKGFADIGAGLPGLADSSVAWGDYDRDGDLDFLLTGRPDSGHPVSQLWRNDGGGAFTNHTPSGLPGVAYGFVAWGDYDNDGDLDFLLTGATSSGEPTSQLWRNEGNGTFSNQTPAGLTGVEAGSVAWGDYDNDGDLDFLLTGLPHGPEPVSQLWRNEGDGTFTNQTPAGPPGVGFSSVAWGDYDNDGDLDFLLTGGTADIGPASQLWRNEGDGVFIEQTSTGLPDVVRSSVAWGDYDNDHDLDIVLTGYTGSDRLSEVYRNESGSFVGIGAGLTSVDNGSAAWGDYDNDGDLDVLLTGDTGSGSVSKVYRNDGTGTFTDISAGLTHVHAGAAAWGDYDNDSVLDILLTGNTGSGSVSEIYRNEECPDLSIGKWVAPSGEVPYRGVVTYTVTVTNTGGIAYGALLTDNLPGELEFAQWITQSGATRSGDVITWTGTVSEHTSLTWSWVEDHTGDYGDLIANTAEFDHPASGQSVSATATFTVEDVMRVTATDPVTNAVGVTLTTDVAATFDHAVSSSTVTTRTFTAQGMMGGLLEGTYSYDSGTWTATLDPGRALFPNELVRTSLTTGLKDTENDPLLPYQWQFTAGHTFERCTGGFTEDLAASAVLTDVAYGSLAWGDYDRDTDLDILLSGEKNNGHPVTRLYRNNGGTFADSGVSITDLDDSSAEWGDYDSDGYVDLLIMGTTSGNHAAVELYHNNRNGTFSLVSGTGLPSMSDGSVDWGDYDNDGHLDILIIGTSDGGWTVMSRVYRNNGDGTFTHTVSFHGVYTGSGAWGDYDNDGDLDALITGMDHNNNAVTRLYRNDDGDFKLVSAGLVNVYCSAVEWGDYDNDGDLDILLAGCSQTADYSRVYRNDGGGTFTNIDAGLTPEREGALAWGDYDNDGDLDILLTGYSDSSSAAFSKVYRNEDGTFTDIGAGLTGVTDSAVAWGDYDNDGDLDVALMGWHDTHDRFMSIVYRNVDCQLRIDKEATPASGVLQGDAVTYTVTMSNTGETASTGTDLTDKLPDDVDFARWITQSGATESHNEIAWSGTVSEHESITWSWVVSYTGYSEIVTNTAEYRTSQGGAWSADATFTAGPYLRMTATDPAAQQQGVTLTTDVTATFDDQVNMATVTTRTFPVQSTMGGLLAGSYSYDSGSQTVTFNPDGTLFAGELVRPVGTYDIQGADGRQLVPYQWQFRAGPVISRCVYGFAADTVAEAALHDVGDSSVAWGDYDNDGHIDILLTGSGVSKVYHNNGNGTFTDIEAGLEGVYDCAAAWGDYDSDGDLDLIVAGDRGLPHPVSRIYRNDGNGTFTDVEADITDVHWGAVAWGDYDNDGDLDLLLTGSTKHSENVSRLYRNDGNDSFERVHAGLTGVYFSAVDWGDYDNDGDLDILLAGSYVSKVYRNDGGGKFTNIGATLTGVYNGSATWGDYDNDGKLDILLAGYIDNHSNPHFAEVYHNEGGGTFTPIGAGLTGVGNSAVAWGDYDNDGRLDILLAGFTLNGHYVSKVYHNDGSGAFAAIGAGLTGVVNGSVAWGDYDNDHDLDILLTGVKSDDHTTSRIYRNEDCYGLSIGKWVVPMTDVAYHGTVTYTVTVTNTGAEDASGTLLTDTLPSEVDFARWVQQSDAVVTNDVITWTGTVSEEESVTWSWVVTHTGDYGDVVTNTSEFVHPRSGESGEADAVFTVQGAPVLSIDKWVSPATDVMYHSVVTYTVIITNTGNPAHDTLFTDTLPAQVDFARWITRSGATESGDEITWTGTVSEGGSLVWAWAVTHTGDYGDVVTNTAVYRHPTSGESGSADATFYVEDAMQVTGTDPLANAVGVTLTTDVAATFDHAVNFGTVSTGTFSAQGMMGGLLDGWFSYDSGSRTVTLDPKRDVFPNEVVRTSLTDGILSTDGDPLVPYQWQFRAGSVLERCAGEFVLDVAAGISVTAVSESAVAWGDYDGDGDLDVLISGADSADVPITQLYRNDGTDSDRHFTAVSVEPSDLYGISFASVKWGDFDSDGDPDIVLTGLDDSDNPLTALYRNDGPGTGDGWTFTEISVQPSGLVDLGYSSADWGDYDNDGDFDILLAGQNAAGTPVTAIYRNDGSGGGSDWTFSRDVAASTVISDVGNGAAIWGDYTNDGWLDVLVAGDAGTDASPDWTARLYRNLGGGTFQEDAHAGEHLPGISSGSADWGDFDRDGDLDILISGAYMSGAISRVYRNDGGYFVHFAELYGHVSGTSVWGDYNNDGYLDVLLTGGANEVLIYQNDEGGGFSEVHSLPGLSLSGAAWGDYDNDNDLDILATGWDGDDPAARFYLNEDCAVLGIGKWANPQTDVDYRGTVTYSVAISNTGGTITGVELSDALPDTVDFARWVEQNGAKVNLADEIIWTGTVTGGQTITWTWVVTHTGGYGDVVTNTALYDSVVSGGSAKAAFSVKGAPALVIDKAASPAVDVDYHSVVTYSVQLTNMGPSDADGTLLTDSLPAEVDFAYWIQQSGASVSDDEITWTGTVTGGISSIHWSWAVTHTGDYGDIVTNTVEAEHPASGQTVDDSATFSVKGAPEFGFTKSVTPDQDVAYRSVVTYTIAMSNTGPSVATGVWMTDVLFPAPEMEFAHWVEQSGAVLTEDAVTWDGTVQPGQWITWSWVMTQYLGYGETAQNTARYGHPDSGASGDATASFNVQPEPGLHISKGVEPDKDVTYHGEVTYTVTLTNTGGPAAGTLLTDVLPVEVDFLRWVEQHGAEVSNDTITWSGDAADSHTTFTWVARYVAEHGGTVTNTAEFDHPDSGQSGNAEAVFTTYNTPPEPPSLISPPDGTYTSDDTPELEWSTSPSPGVAGYWLDFHGVPVDVGDTTRYTTTVLADGTYTWTVAAYDHLHNTSPYTDVWSFTVDTVPPDPPTLVRPVNGAAITDTTPTLAWLASPSADVAGYDLDFNGSPLDVGNVVSYTTPVLADGTYTWTVDAYDRARNTSPYTDTWSFTVDTSGPSVTATSPVSGAMAVAVSAPVVVTFDEPIVTGTFGFVISPDPGGWSAQWDETGAVVTLSHDLFSTDTRYTATVTSAVDPLGNPMKEPYAWWFHVVDHVYFLPWVVKNY